MTAVRVPGSGALVESGDAPQPPDVQCSCGRWLPRVRHVPRGPSTGVVGRSVWAYPKHSPCRDCAPDKADELRRETHRRLRGSNVPEDLWQYNVDSYVVQTAAADDVFIEQCRRVGKLGVFRRNAAAFQVVVEWLDRGARDWLLLTGPPGVGKSTLMCAIAHSLLEASELEPVKLPEEKHSRPPREDANTLGWAYMAERGLDRAYRRPEAPRQVWYETVDELLERERTRMNGEPFPRKQVVQYPVLLLDELARDANRSRFEIEVVEQVLGTRADRGRTTVLASNATWAELTGEGGQPPIYGARVADRIYSAHHCCLGGDSWRPRVNEERRRRGRKGKGT